jgi:hypothetical protein
MVGIEAALISADITTIVVTAFIAAVPAAPECTLVGVATGEVVTAAAVDMAGATSSPPQLPFRLFLPAE